MSSSALVASVEEVKETLFQVMWTLVEVSFSSWILIWLWSGKGNQREKHKLKEGLMVLRGLAAVVVLMWS